MATQTKVIGPISAYAIAVQEGYTGTKEEWAAEIGNAQENAQTAQAAADRVQTLTESLPDDYTDTIANFAPTYSAEATYAEGDYVIHYGSLFKCKTPITAGESWTPAHWTQVNVGGEVSGLESAFNHRDETTAILSAIRTYADNQDVTYNSKRIQIIGNRVITSGTGTQTTYRNGNLTGSVFSFRDGGTTSFNVLDTDFVSTSIFDAQGNSPWRWFIHIVKNAASSATGYFLIFTKKDGTITKRNLWDTGTGEMEFYSDVLSMIGDADEFALYLQIKNSNNAEGDYTINFHRAYYQVTPEAFGAVGDGVTDDTAAIQNCLNSSLNVVFGENKTYICSDLPVRDHHNINLNGATLKTTLNHAIFITDPSDNAVRAAHIYNGILMGDSTDNTKAGQILIRLSAFYSTFENLQIYNCYDGIRMIGRTDGSSDSTVENVFRNLKFVNCYNIGLNITNEGNITDSRIEGVFANAPSGSQYNIYVGKSAGVIISNVHLYGSPMCHLSVRSASHTLISNAYLEGSYTTAGIAQQLTRNLSISNVTVLAGAAGCDMIRLNPLSGTSASAYRYVSLNGITLEATGDRGLNAVNSIVVGTGVVATGSNIVISDTYNTIKDPAAGTGLIVKRLGTNVAQNLAPIYDIGTAYNAGDYVMKSGVLYRITADITAENNAGWDAVSKTQVTVGGELQNLYSLITTLFARSD